MTTTHVTIDDDIQGLDIAYKKQVSPLYIV